MKLTKISQVQDFLAAVNKAKNNVWLIGLAQATDLFRHETFRSHLLKRKAAQI